MRKKINFNILDFFILICICFSFSGYLLAKAEKTGLNKVIEGKEKIAIEILIPDVYSSNEKLFMIGQKSSITIRNQPYTALEIVDLQIKPQLIILPNLNGNYKIIENPLRKDTKDYLVTLGDEGLKTKDGYVIGGNKIKIGNHVELEGFSYRLTGKVTNIYPLKN